MKFISVVALAVGASAQLGAPHAVNVAAHVPFGARAPSVAHTAPVVRAPIAHGAVPIAARAVRAPIAHATALHRAPISTGLPPRQAPSAPPPSPAPAAQENKAEEAAEEAAKKAEEAAKKAEEAAKKAEEDAKKAEEDAKKAEEDAKKAEEDAKEREEARKALQKSRESIQVMYPKLGAANMDAQARHFGDLKNLVSFASDKDQLNDWSKWGQLESKRILGNLAHQKVHDLRQSGADWEKIDAAQRDASHADQTTYVKYLEAFKGDSYKKPGDAADISLFGRHYDQQKSYEAYQKLLHDDEADAKAIEKARSNHAIDSGETFSQFLFTQGKPKQGALMFASLSAQTIPDLEHAVRSAADKYREDPTQINDLKWTIAEKKLEKAQATSINWLFNMKGNKLLDAVSKSDASDADAEVKALELRVAELEYQSNYNDFYFGDDYYNDDDNNDDYWYEPAPYRLAAPRPVSRPAPAYASLNTGPAHRSFAAPAYHNGPVHSSFAAPAYAYGPVHNSFAAPAYASLYSPPVGRSYFP